MIGQLSGAGQRASSRRFAGPHTRWTGHGVRPMPTPALADSIDLAGWSEIEQAPVRPSYAVRYTFGELAGYCPGRRSTFAAHSTSAYANGSFALHF